MKVKLCKGVKVRKEEFGGIVLRKRRGAQQVDSIGYEILSQIKKGVEIEEIIENMKKEYAGDHEKIEADVHKYIEMLVEGGVIEIEEH